MPKFLADENFDGRVLREIKRRLPSLEVARVQDVRLMSIKDELILEWAASQEYAFANSVFSTDDLRSEIYAIIQCVSVRLTAKHESFLA